MYKYYQIPARFLILFIFTTITYHSNSQNPSWQWANGTGKYISHDYCSSISTDKSGNSYITGNFQDSLVFGNTLLLNTGTYGSIMYVAKYDNQGNVIWANQPGGNHSADGLSICTDASGFFYITGSFSGTIIFGPTTLTATGPSNVFVAKYDSSGNALWAQKAHAYFSCKGTGVTVDNSGNVFITGVHEDSIFFGSIALPGDLSSSFFVAKYDNTGAIQWAKTANGHGSDISNGICADESGNIYITGTFRDSIQLGSIMLYGTNNGSAALLVVKYDGSGNVLWAKSNGGFPSSGIGKGISTDPLGNCYVVGYFGSPIFYIDGDTLTNLGVEDVFVLKLNSNGTISWLRQGGGQSFDRGHSICTDETGNSYITGFFKNASTFGNINFSGSNNDGFVVKYDSSGVVQWGIQNTGAVNDLPNGISTDGHSIFIGGEFSSPTCFFGSITLTNSDQFLGSYDLFIAKIIYSTTGIFNNPNTSHSIKIYPNPTTDKSLILFDNADRNNFTLTLYDSKGKLVCELYDITSNTIEIDMSSLSTGLYIVKLYSDNHKALTCKFIVE